MLLPSVSLQQATVFIMSFLGKIFGASGAAAPASRAIAKDRLSVILASQRGSELLEGVDMEEMQREVLAVVQVGNEKPPDFADVCPFIGISINFFTLSAVQRHIDIAKNKPVNFSVNAAGDVRVFEMQVELGHRNPNGQRVATIAPVRE